MELTEVNVTNRGTVGGGFLGLLFLTFLVLKLTSVISWSWWWVTAPLWGPAFLLICFALVAFGALSVYKGEQRKRNV